MPNRFNNRWLPKVLYTNTLDWVVGLILLLTAARVLSFGMESVPATVESLGLVLSTAYTVFMVVGGAGILIGLFGIKHFWSAGFIRAGLWFGGTAFFCYGILLALTGFNPPTTLAMVTMLVLALGCFVRAHGVGIDTKANLDLLRAVNRAMQAEERADRRE